GETGQDQMEQDREEQPMAGEEGGQQDLSKLQDLSFDEVDKDGDENLSLYELEEAGVQIDEQKYGELDEDNDGVLGEEEFEKAKEEQ
ncbi:MAG: hypothetical protein ACLFTB_05025, partial [Desulfovibrionales bacterium]